MRRGSILTALLAALAFAALASAATDEVRLCGVSKGRTIAAGNYPQGNVPRTKCSFAKATNRRVLARERGAGLRSQFTLTVRGQRLSCTWSKGSVEEIRCRNHRRFVLLYRFT